MDKRVKRLIKTVLKFGLTIAALYFVFTRIEFGSVMGLIAGSDLLLLLAAFLLFVASKIVSAFRLNIFFRRTGLDLTELQNLRLYLLGMFYNLFLPGGIGGDGYKIYLLQKHYKTGTVKLFGSVLTDRLSGMAMLAVLALLLFSLIDIPLWWNRAGFLLIPLVIAGLYLFCRLFYRYFLPVFTRTMLYSLLVQVLQMACATMIVLALGGGGGQLPDYLLVFLVSSMIAVLPISIGGMGVRELTFMYGAGLLGIDQGLAVSVSLLFYIITAMVSLAGVYYVIRPIKFEEKAILSGPVE